MALPVRLPLTKAKRANKFNARKVDYDGYTFGSIKEYERYLVLKEMDATGEISGLCVHPKFRFDVKGRKLLIRSKGFPNGKQVTWTPDFQYIRPGLGLITEDVKGKRGFRRSPTDDKYYRLKKAIFECLYWPARVEEV